MNRDQAAGILENIDIVRHYAHGGDIGFRLHDYKGDLVGIYPARGLNLSGIAHGGTHYVMLKAKLAWNPFTRCFERKERCTLSNVSESEIIQRKEE